MAQAPWQPSAEGLHQLLNLFRTSATANNEQHREIQQVRLASPIRAPSLSSRPLQGRGPGAPQRDVASHARAPRCVCVCVPPQQLTNFNAVPDYNNYLVYILNSMKDENPSVRQTAGLVCAPASWGVLACSLCAVMLCDHSDGFVRVLVDHLCAPCAQVVLKAGACLISIVSPRADAHSCRAVPAHLWSGCAGAQEQREGALAFAACRGAELRQGARLAPERTCGRGTTVVLPSAARLDAAGAGGACGRPAGARLRPVGSLGRLARWREESCR